MNRNIFLTLGLLATTALSLSAESLSYTGTLGSPEDVFEISFTLSSTSTVTVQTWSFGGGVNANGQTIGAGGFDPLIAIFSGTGTSATIVTDNSGNPLVDADNLSNPPWAFVGNCPPAGLVAIGSNYDCGDDWMQITLTAGTYTLLLSDANYIPAAINDNGSLLEGFTDLTAGVFQTCDPAVDTCIIPTGNYAVDITSPGLVNAPAMLTTPGQGATFTGASATFTWEPVAGATEYVLFLGSTGVGSANLSGKVATGATLTVNNLPLNGETIYARLWTYFGSVKASNDYTFTAASPAALTSPAQAATLTGSGQTFTWAPVAGATSYDLFLGTTGVGSVNLRGKVTTDTTLTVNNLPLNGETIYVRLQTNFNGMLAHNDYTFTASSPAALTSPTPGTTFSSPSQTFTWTPSVGATNYTLLLGSTGVGSSNLYGKITAASTLAANNLPVNGKTIYARLVTNFNGIVAHTDSTFTALSPAALTTPTPGATLTSASQAFGWTPIAGAYNYTLWLGSTGVGSNDLYNSHTTGGTLTANNLPTNGEKIYARLFTNFSTVSGYTDSTFTAVIVPATLTSPAQGATLAATNQSFTWTAPAGATSYILWLGSTGVGSANLYGKATTATTLTVPYPPTNGETVYVRLWTYYNSVRTYTDYTFTAQ